MWGSYTDANARTTKSVKKTFVMEFITQVQMQTF